jgi:hypothetical protein
MGRRQRQRQKRLNAFFQKRKQVYEEEKRRMEEERKRRQEEKKAVEQYDSILFETERMFRTYCRWYGIMDKCSCNGAVIARTACDLLVRNGTDNYQEYLEGIDDALRWVLKPLRKRVPPEGYGDLTEEINEEFIRISPYCYATNDEIHH